MSSPPIITVKLFETGFTQHQNLLFEFFISEEEGHENIELTACEISGGPKVHYSFGSYNQINFEGPLGLEGSLKKISLNNGGRSIPSIWGKFSWNSQSLVARGEETITTKLYFEGIIIVLDS